MEARIAPQAIPLRADREIDERRVMAFNRLLQIFECGIHISECSVHHGQLHCRKGFRLIGGKLETKL